MRIIIVKNYDEMSKKAAKIIAEQIKVNPNSVLGLPAGSTPLGAYGELIRMHKEENLDFSKTTVFVLNEYYGLEQGSPYSLYRFIFENFLAHINISQEKIHAPNGLSNDVEAHCREYEEDIKKAGGIDLMLLGIGRNGHIGFNEPGSSLTSRTMLTVLSEETIKDNLRFFEREEEIPRFAITVGCGTIMEARRIILLASGSDKADAIAATIEGAITTQVPASILQMHPDAILIIDEEAALKLRKKHYYRYIEKMLEEVNKKQQPYEPPIAQTTQNLDSLQQIVALYSTP